MSEILLGVCCEFCKKMEGPECPVKEASPWSRWKSYCGEYEPNPEQKDAVTIEQAIKNRALVYQGD
jgi:hypothetical protein